MKNQLSLIALLVMMIFVNGRNLSFALDNLQPIPIALPNGSGGIGFDDLGYDAQLGKILVPAGRTGNLDLIDPVKLTITTISGFTAQDRFAGGHGEGTTSVDSGQGLLFAIDRSSRKLEVVDPATNKIVGSAALDSDPDYVRYVELTHELWITEPDREQIEVFAVPDESEPSPVFAAVIPIKGGPESLVIDKTRGRAYTHLWAGTTEAIDLKTRAVVAEWSNGCGASRGIALDETRGFLFAGCSEGKAVVLDLNHDGQQLSSLEQGAGVDVISYNPTLRHLYVPSASTGTMGILDVASDGTLSLLGVADTAKDAHCVTADDQGNVWVCDPDHGQILLVKDSFPPDTEVTPTVQK
jgi:hypothetical protein